MSRRVRIGLIVLGLVCSSTVLLLVYANHAVRQVQPFYVAAIDVDPDLLEGASQEMENRVATLYREPVQESGWQAVFSDTEVNGWLAVALAEKYADLLSDKIVDPRVAFEEGEFVIGFRYTDKNFETVVSVRASVTVPEPDVISVRLIRAHAGTLPLPTSTVVEAVQKVVQEQGAELRWSEADGKPVALIPLLEVFSTADEKRLLETVEFRERGLMLSGSAKSSKAMLAEQPTSTTLR